VHETSIEVRWGELDPYHHVNHAAYLSYLEHARIAALESIGWGMEAIAAAGRRVVVVRIDVRFRAPARGGDRLTVATALVELRGAGSTWRQTVRNGDRVLVDATVVAACTDLHGRPARTPPPLQEALQTLVTVAE
jgi:YbgC/YbaW family acyl-CoA thioester hydrolase